MWWWQLWESTPEHATHWSRKKMAERSGLSKSTIGRIWKGFSLKPHLTDGFKLSNDPMFVDKVYDVVGLYLGACCRRVSEACLHRGLASNRAPSQS
jgi:transcriptional regulator with XRE-family HTH domain